MATVFPTQERILDPDTGLVIGVRSLEPPPDQYADPFAISDEQFEARLPKPVGYKILVTLPKVDDKFEGTSIQKVNSTVQAEAVTSVIALVLDMGPDCYPLDKYPGGPWCKVGDYVLIGPYKGSRFAFMGQEYRLLHDDSIEAVVADPAGYRRV